uniref:WD_REPEATS_REGION domain-containing protein n=1 Tax=Rhabditophanes sp. KR3021 TaxID=114890 RepID=A0AC35TZX5_9BILA
MGIHQIITGALNSNYAAYSLGCKDGFYFIACSVGCDIVILNASLIRIQVIPYSLDEESLRVSSISCCPDSGKIAAVYGTKILIYEPTFASNEDGKTLECQYIWKELQEFSLAGPIHNMQWCLEGNRIILSVLNDIIIFQSRQSRSSPNSVLFTIDDSSRRKNSPWDLIFRTSCSEPVKLIKVSTDSVLFASCGVNDRLIKIWYQVSNNQTYATKKTGDMVSFDSTYIQHPAAVIGFEWRKTAKDIPRKNIQNVLVSWCKDNTSRIWKEIVSNEATFTDINGEQSECYVTDKTSKRKHFKNFGIKAAKSKLMNKMHQLIHERKKTDNTTHHFTVNRSSIHANNHYDICTNNIQCNSVNFYLAASINSENDCLLVPSMSNKNEKIRKPFTVHWLNNKEIMFNFGSEKILTETLKEQGNSNFFNDNANLRGTSTTMLSNLHRRASTTMNDVLADAIDRNGSNRNSVKLNNVPNESTSPSVSSENYFCRDSLDVKLDLLFREWTKGGDMLFSIHPVDGSLLTWTVDYLDDPFRQPSVSFTSRFPNAFPLTDASSILPNIFTFSPHNPLYLINYIQKLTNKHQDEHQKEGNSFDEAQEHTSDEEEKSKGEKLIESEKTLDYILESNVLSLLTSHENGSLNLWHLSMEERSKYKIILNVSHKRRMCGHRFSISSIVSHSVLPLCLTSSSIEGNKHTNTPYESELILWQVSPVGPLCISGGLRELARISSLNDKSFSHTAWVPTILTSSALGKISNSPSSCFVASVQGHLKIYQVIVDARGLLSELQSFKKNRDANFDASSMSSDEDGDILMEYQMLLQNINVVSTQSTSKPGCILQLDDIPSSAHTNSNIIFLHIFNERSLVHAKETFLPKIQNNDVGDNFISEVYYLIMITKENDKEKLRMWALNFSTESLVSTNKRDTEEKGNLDSHYYKPASPTNIPHFKLKINPSLVYEEFIPLPNGNRVLSATPVAGHLPSANLYPACRAPYQLILSCLDDSIHFMKCTVNQLSEKKYNWSFWNMITNDVKSAVDIDGQISALSAAHSGRFACAYRLPGNENLEVSVYECESTGGVEWRREDYFPIKSFMNSNFLSKYGIDKKQYYNNPSFNEARLDWVSMEDGGYILTVGIKNEILLYAQMSCDAAQQNIVMMKDQHEIGKRSLVRQASSLAGTMQIRSQDIRWVCIRRLEFDSVDGLLPIPTAISWVRDGIFVVGMPSEIRCYNQWNFVNVEMKSDVKSVVPPTSKTIAKSPSSILSKSTPMLDQLHKKNKKDINGAKMMKEIMSKVFSTQNNLDRVKESAFVAYGQTMTNTQQQEVLEALSDDGLFEAARLANPMLPQYHPKQLIEMLNAGKSRRVKLILLHILQSLKKRNVSMPNPLCRAASLRKMTSVEARKMTFPQSGTSFEEDERKKSIINFGLENETLDYEELDGIAPIPLYVLFSADECSGMTVQNDNNDISPKEAKNYDGLFADTALEDDYNEDWDEMDEKQGNDRSRHNSSGSDILNKAASSIVFHAKHTRQLTELLTHTHLPGLSSVDQMHLLAIADTLSHFSSDVMDKLTQANAELEPEKAVFFNDSAAGYATAGAGVDTIDECGLRFLMALKQHEFLLKCLPMNQRHMLRRKGVSTSNTIWAFHSESETELLNAIPCFQKENVVWEEIKCYGVGWWLKNLSSIKICIEKLAKNAFQKSQEPLDSALLYLALRKKNVLSHLFRSVRNSKLAEFFANDFSADRWRTAASKNAYVLIGQQRFMHAAAFFLLSGDLQGCLQVIIGKMNDVQLALVVLKLYITNSEEQTKAIQHLLCKYVLGINEDDLVAWRTFGNKKEHVQDVDKISFSKLAKKDPFLRSMAFWTIKEYSLAAHTLLKEAHIWSSLDNLDDGMDDPDHNLSDIFNFYSHLRKHPLVVRQRLTAAGVNVASTDRFLSVAKKLGERVTASERRLFFRTASVHMTSGCPLLALDVLQRLPSNIQSVVSDSVSLNEIFEDEPKQELNTLNKDEKVDNFDWSQPTNVVDEDELKLDWSDDEKSERSSIADNVSIKEEANPDNVGKDLKDEDELSEDESLANLDVLSQHMKFVACLKILIDELSMLASGFVVDGGQLRSEVLKWLEEEVNTLKKLCAYRPDGYGIEDTSTSLYLDSPIDTFNSSFETRKDLIDLHERSMIVRKRREWLTVHQTLIRSFTTYCALHCAHNYRLTSALMELLLLLLEVQQGDFSYKNANDPIPEIQSFPLLVSSISTYKMFLQSPLNFIENQSSDLLLSVIQLKCAPVIDYSLPKMYAMYSLCQGLSACVYQSLSDIQGTFLDSGNNSNRILSKSIRKNTMSQGTNRVITAPSKWPGVETLTSLMIREKDEEAPNLRILLSESHVAIVMALFCYSLSAYDARWLYRLVAHQVNTASFGKIFGGGGMAPQAKPNIPPRPAKSSISTIPENATKSPPPSVATMNIREKNLHNKVFGTQSDLINESKKHASDKPRVSFSKPHPETLTTSSGSANMWVPPTTNIVQFFADKPEMNTKTELGVDYDSDDEDNELEEEEETYDEFGNPIVNFPHHDPFSYAWLLLRLALIKQQKIKIEEFLTMCGYDINELSSISPKMDHVLKLLDVWFINLQTEIENFEGGVPNNLLPNMTMDKYDKSQQTPLHLKYKALMDPNNTPFELQDKYALPVKRLWVFLTRQKPLSEIFIKHIYVSDKREPKKSVKIENAIAAGLAQSSGTIANPWAMSDIFKLIHKEQEPIVAFSVNKANPNVIVVSNGREIQEMDISPIFEEEEKENKKRLNVLYSQTEVDIASEKMVKDTFRSNDDYQIYVDSAGYPSQMVNHHTTLQKKPLVGVRRLESHPSLDIYVTGASDGSINVRKFEVDQPLMIARQAGQYAKVTKLAFSLNGNKFAAVDGDGMLSLWQICSQVGVTKKPFLNQKAHSKSASDVMFLGPTSTFLATVGHSSNEANVTLWDTLMPTNKCQIHSFNAHVDGALCVNYVPSSQTLITGGKYGEVNVWDVRQRQLRSTVKVFENSTHVKCITADYASDLFLFGSSDGDIKVYTSDMNGMPLFSMPSEHPNKGGFSLRQVGNSAVQGVQKMYVDPFMRIYSCGGDYSLKIRSLPQNFH